MDWQSLTGLTRTTSTKYRISRMWYVNVAPANWISGFLKQLSGKLKEKKIIFFFYSLKPVSVNFNEFLKFFPCEAHCVFLMREMWYIKVWLGSPYLTHTKPHNQKYFPTVWRAQLGFSSEVIETMENITRKALLHRERARLPSAWEYHSHISDRKSASIQIDITYLPLLVLWHKWLVTVDLYPPLPSPRDLFWFFAWKCLTATTAHP